MLAARDEEQLLRLSRAGIEAARFIEGHERVVRSVHEQERAGSDLCDLQLRPEVVVRLRRLEREGGDGLLPDRVQILVELRVAGPLRLPLPHSAGVCEVLKRDVGGLPGEDPLDPVGGQAILEIEPDGVGNSIADRATRISEAIDTGHGADPLVARRARDDDTTPKAPPHEPDPLGIRFGLLLEKGDRVSDVLDLFLGEHATPFAVTGAEAAIVEGEAHVPSFDELGPPPGGHPLLETLEARADDDRRAPLVAAIWKVQHEPLEPDAIAIVLDGSRPHTRLSPARVGTRRETECPG